MTVTADTGKTGTFNIDPDYELELSASIAAGQTISFAPEGTGILEIDDLSNVGAAARNSRSSMQRSPARPTAI